MSPRLLDRTTRPPAPTSAPTAALPDRGHDAVSALTRLSDQLAGALNTRNPAWWKEPPVFFFDRRRQVEYSASLLAPAAGPLTDLSDAIQAELPRLFASVEVRRVARAIDRLRSAVQALAPDCPPARDLAELLAIPEDEVFLVLHPTRREGFRLVVRGVVDVGQFHVLATDAMTGEPAGFLPGPPVAERFVAAYRDINPAVPAGVPMVVEARHQLYTPSALQADGSLPAGFEGCRHWLWPTMPLAAVPSINGERVVLVGPPAFAMTWDVSRRFPALAAKMRLIETLGPTRVDEYLARLTGGAIPSQATPVLSSAA